MISPDFLLTTCQVGAEGALKKELARLWPDFRFAYSRPGFVTFKLPNQHGLADDFDMGSVFARSYSFSLGKAVAPTLAERLALVAARLEGQSYDQLHVFERDRYPPGEHRFEPGPTPAASEVEAALRGHLSNTLVGDRTTPPATPGQRVLDVVLVGEDEWWLGTHGARQPTSCWPGGLRTIVLPEYAVSRAYLKMAEGLQWSRLPIQPGQLAAEIGCAPGGSCQALLDCGVSVIGVDPAEVDAVVTAHPRFRHLRKRGHEVRKSEFRDVTWLFADLNVVPQYTLDTVEQIVSQTGTNVRGLLLTLKLLEWDMADDLPGFLERIGSWGFRSVRARQLQYNRREVCVAAERTTSTASISVGS